MIRRTLRFASIRARRSTRATVTIGLRLLFRVVSSRLAYSLLVLVDARGWRGGTTLANALRPVVIRDLRARPDMRLSGWSTAWSPTSEETVLLNLGVFQELADLLQARGVALLSLDRSLKLIWALFELGRFEEAFEVASAWSETRISDHHTLMEARALLGMATGREADSARWLAAAAVGMPHLLAPHQNIAGRYSTDYAATPLDLAAGEDGRIYDGCNFIGQRVVHVGAGHRCAGIFAGALRAQQRLHAKLPRPSRALLQLLKQAEIDYEDLRILPVEWFTQIGHLGMMDILFRMRELGWWRGSALFLVPTDKVANHAFLSLFEPQGTLVPKHRDANPELMAELFSLQRYCGLSFNAFELPTGEIVPWQEAGAIAMRQYEAEGRGVPLRDAFDRRFGALETVAAPVERILQQWGLGPDDWYVCLHMRDAAHYGETEGTGQTHRNATVERYRSAIEYITRQGGWVIKLGGADSPKLPKMARLIDYGRSKFKSEIMDLHLIRHARLFIGTTSGLTNVAISFDVPCALVNCITTDAQLWTSKVRFTLKPIRLKTGRQVSQRELTSTPWRWRIFSAEVMSRYAATALETDSDDLLETVKEVHCLATGSDYVPPIAIAPDLLARWNDSLHIKSYYGGARPGLYFLQKNADYLLASQSHEPAAINKAAPTSRALSGSLAADEDAVPGAARFPTRTEARPGTASLAASRRDS